MKGIVVSTNWGLFTPKGKGLGLHTPAAAHREKEWRDRGQYFVLELSPGRKPAVPMPVTEGSYCLM